MVKNPLIIDKRGPTKRFSFNSGGTGRVLVSEGFDFDSITGLALDINPTSNKVDAVDDGDPVQTLDDSKAAISYVQTNLAKRPLWNESDANFNNKPSLTFDGIDDILRHGSAFLTSTRGCIFSVVKRDVSSVVMSIISMADEVTSLAYFRKRSKEFVTPINVDVLFRSTEVDKEVRGSTNIGSTAYILMLISNGTTYNFRANLTEETEVVISHGNQGDWWGDVSSPNNIVLGSTKHTSEVDYYDGEIARILVYDGVDLTTEEQDTIINNLNTLYGIF
jgi:hypothetical protein